MIAPQRPKRILCVWVVCACSCSGSCGCCCSSSSCWCCCEIEKIIQQKESKKGNKDTHTHTHTHIYVAKRLHESTRIATPLEQCGLCGLHGVLGQGGPRGSHMDPDARRQTRGSPHPRSFGRGLVLCRGVAPLRTHRLVLETQRRCPGRPSHPHGLQGTNDQQNA